MSAASLRILSSILLSGLICVAGTAGAATTEYGNYSTKGHAKAQGVDISIDHPITWQPAGNPKPGIVQEFRDPNTGGRDALLIVVPSPQSKKLTPKKFREGFSLPEMQERIMPGAKHRKKEFIEGLSYPCVALDYDLAVPQFAPEVIQVRNYIFLIEKQMVQIQFYAIGPEAIDLREQRAEMMMHIVRSVRQGKNTDH